MRRERSMANYVWERYSFLELSSIQMSEPNNRPTVRNLILAKSQTSSLNNQRCQLSFIAKCVSLSHAVCGCWSMLSSVSINTRTHTHSLSLSLRYLALFPHISILFKSSLCHCLIINWSTDFTVLSCSHFIGSINTKYVLLVGWCGQGILKGEVSLYHWPPVWLVGLACFANKNKNWQLSYRWFKTSQTGGQR